MPVNLSNFNLASGIAKRAIPNLVTILRLTLVWPMVAALSSHNYAGLLLWIVLFLLLDNADGILARKLKAVSTTGKFLDSAVDKTASVIVLTVAFYFQIIPVFLFVIIILISTIQLLFSFWAVFFLERKKLPRTYLPIIGGGLLVISLFLSGTPLNLAYFLIIVIYANHFYYYALEIFRNELALLRPTINRQIDQLKRLLAKIPVLGAISRYVFLKSIKRNEPEPMAARLFTVGNLVTLGRLLLIPVIIYCYWLQLNLLWIILLAVFIGADFLDGALARHYQQVSHAGKVMDAVVDKFLFATFLLVWLLQGLLPHWLFYLLVVRILLILGMAGIIWLSKKKPYPIAYFSFFSITSLVFFVYKQSDFWLIITILLTWQLIVNYWHQGIGALLNKKVVV